MSLRLPTAAGVDALHQKLDELLERTSPAPTAQLKHFFEQLTDGSGALGFEPLRVYSAKEVAKLLGLKSEKSVYNIPEKLLPKVRRIGTHIGYHGINVLAYQLGKEPVDVEAAFERYREKILQDRPKVQPLANGTTGVTRVR